MSVDPTDFPASTPKPASASTSPALRKVIFVMLVGVLLYGAVAVWRGLDKFGAVLGSFHGQAFLFACALAFGNYVLRFLKWEFYLARLGIRGVPKFDSFLIYLSGFVLTVTPGKVGEVFKSAVLEERYGVPLPRTAPIVVAERITDVLGIVVLIAIGSTAFSGGLVWAGIGGGLVAVLLVVIMSRRLSLGIIDLVAKLPKLGGIAPKLRTSYENLTVLVLPRNLLVPTLISLFAWLLECLALYEILRGFGASVPVAPCLFIYATSTLAGAIVPVPGGLGVTEGTMLKQLTSLAHVEDNIAAAAMMLVRFATLWFAVLVGFVSLSILRARPRPEPLPAVLPLEGP